MEGSSCRQERMNGVHRPKRMFSCGLRSVNVLHEYTSTYGAQRRDTACVQVTSRLRTYRFFLLVPPGLRKRRTTLARRARLSGRRIDSSRKVTARGLGVSAWRFRRYRVFTMRWMEHRRAADEVARQSESIGWLGSQEEQGKNSSGQSLPFHVMCEFMPSIGLYRLNGRWNLLSRALLSRLRPCFHIRDSLPDFSTLYQRPLATFLIRQLQAEVRIILGTRPP